MTNEVIDIERDIKMKEAKKHALLDKKKTTLTYITIILRALCLPTQLL